jgi:hypothetical protein
MKRLHPLWLTLFILVVTAPASVATASIVENPFVRAYAIFHVFIAVIGITILSTNEVPFLIPRSVTPKRDLEIEILRKENQQLVEALIDGRDLRKQAEKEKD